MTDHGADHPADRPAGANDRVTRRAKTRAPGFDGLRALAVLAVMAFHDQFTAMPGGFLGVDVFFVLSGYLITDLLVTQWRRNGGLDLRGFWVRRARRLFPALAAVLVTVATAAAVIEPAQLGQLRPALIAAVTYSSNWWQASHHQSYFTAFGPPPPLQHLWSLAIEEQFYLAWPLILALLLMLCQRRRLRAAAAWLAAAISALTMAVLYTPGADPSRVYYGTDTHSTALLVGTALALTWPLGELVVIAEDKARRLDVAGVFGIAVLAWGFGHYSGADAALYPAGLAIAALAAGAIVMAAAGKGTVGTILSWQPLRWLGVRSYGIYLWHWPAIALAAAVAGPERRSGWVWFIQTAAAIVFAAASWRWIETPILRDGFRTTFRARYQALTGSLAASRRSPARAIPAVALALALGISFAAGYQVLRAPASAGLQRQITEGAAVSAATGVGATGAGAARLRDGSARSAAATASPSAGSLSHPGKVPGGQVTAIGDSVMLAAAPQLHAAMRGIYIDATVSRQMSAGLQTVRRLADGGLLRSVVVVDLGTNGPVTSQQIRQLLVDIGPRRELVLVNIFVPQPWEHEVNRVLSAAARGDAQVVLANWWKAIDNHTGLLWGDGVHPRPPGASLYAHVVAAAVQATQGRSCRA